MSVQAGLPAWIGLHLALAASGTWLARRYALHRQLLDQPGERRSHSVATPRGGGIAIVIALLVGLAWLWLRNPLQGPYLLATASGLMLVAGIGWIDDHRALPPWPKLAVHVLASLLLGWAVLVQTGSVASASAAIGLALVLVNVWNFMDGIDGLATTQAAIVAIAYALYSRTGVAALLALALTASCVGFLPFNFPRARIFLGDVGSGALGFILAAIVAGVSLDAGVSSILLLLPLSAFLIDATLTLMARMLRGERWWQPHVQHAYQHWARDTGRHGVVTMAYAGWTLGAVAIMLVARNAGIAVMSIIVAAWYLAGSIVWLRMRQGHRGTAWRDRE